MQTLDEYVWMFVGCGGTFYAASPYLAVLYCRYAPRHEIILIDPDIVEKDNYGRQWPGWTSGGAKVECADTILGTLGLELVSRFQETGDYLDEATDGRPVLAIVNVDNDQTRLDVASWLEKRISPSIMVVSGCEQDHGQVYPGIWMEGEPVYDWRKVHTDVGRESTGPVNPCQAQTIQANALTGVLVGMCIEDIATRLRDGTLNFVREFFWNTGRKTGEIGRLLNMWATTEECERGIVL